MGPSSPDRRGRWGKAGWGQALVPLGCWGPPRNLGLTAQLLLALGSWAPQHPLVPQPGFRCTPVLRSREQGRRPESPAPLPLWALGWGPGMSWSAGLFAGAPGALGVSTPPWLVASASAQLPRLLGALGGSEGRGLPLCGAVLVGGPLGAGPGVDPFEGQHPPLCLSAALSAGARAVRWPRSPGGRYST